jgi:hypothetical protein
MEGFVTGHSQGRVRHRNSLLCFHLNADLSVYFLCFFPEVAIGKDEKEGDPVGYLEKERGPGTRRIEIKHQLQHQHR